MRHDDTLDFRSILTYQNMRDIISQVWAASATAFSQNTQHLELLGGSAAS